ncbi:hypothetical protein HAX54_013604, partial [Datura stramonium]|nr:hypothetical protein [Datura stramonium]
MAKDGRELETRPMSTSRMEPSKLSPEDWQIVIGMLKFQRSNSNDKMDGKPSNKLWIIDTGATNH